MSYAGYLEQVENLVLQTFFGVEAFEEDDQVVEVNLPQVSLPFEVLEEEGAQLPVADQVGVLEVLDVDEVLPLHFRLVVLLQIVQFFQRVCRLVDIPSRMWFCQFVGYLHRLTHKTYT